MKLAAALLLLALLLASPSRADLTATGNGDCRYGQNDTFYELQSIAATPIDDPDGAATLAACVYSKSIGPVFPYVGTMDLFVSVAGLARAHYGALAGRIEYRATATPDRLERNPPNPGDFFQNNYFAKFEQAELLMHSADAGDVASGTLGAGTPVTLAVSVAKLTNLLYAGRPTDLQGNSAEGTGSIKIEDSTNHTSSPQFSLGLGDVAFDFATTVGARLLITFDYTVVAEGRAGRDLSDNTKFYPDVEGHITSGAYLRITPPANVTFVADSGAQYDAPEPAALAQLASAIAAIGVIAPLRARLAARAAGRASA